MSQRGRRDMGRAKTRWEEQFHQLLEGIYRKIIAVEEEEEDLKLTFNLSQNNFAAIQE